MHDPMDNSPAGNAPAPDPAGDEVEGVADIIPGSEDEETAAGGPSQSEEEEMCRYCHDPAGETPGTLMCASRPVLPGAIARQGPRGGQRQRRRPAAASLEPLRIIIPTPTPNLV